MSRPTGNDRGPRRFGPSSQADGSGARPARPAPSDRDPAAQRPTFDLRGPDRGSLRPGQQPRGQAGLPADQRGQVGRPADQRGPSADPRNRQQQPGGARPALLPRAEGAAAGRRPDSPVARREQRPNATQRAWSELDQPRTSMMPAGAAAGAAARGNDAGAGRPPGPPVPPRRVPPGGPGGTGGGGSGPRRNRGGVLAGRIVATVAAVALLLVCGIAFIANPQGTSQAQEKAKQAGKSFPGMTILLIGSDARSDANGNPLTPEQLAQVSTTLDGGATNTDTMMLLHIPEGGGRATAVSIPRDTWIPQSVIEGIDGPYSDGSTGPYKPNKINAYYGTAMAYTQQALAKQGVNGAERQRRSQEAGRQMLIEVLSKFTGVYIDHFAEVNLIAFYDISKALGGVPVCLKKPVDDPYSGAKFDAGLQTVEGSSALSFVRQRHGLPGGDLDRERRQQVFLASALKTAQSSPGKLPGLLDVANKDLVMDAGLDLLTLAEQMKAISAGQVDFMTMPTQGAAKGVGTDALAADPDTTQQFFDKTMGDGGATTDPGTTGTGTGTGTGERTTGSTGDSSRLEVDVESGVMTSGVGRQVANTLSEAGFQVGAPTDMEGKSDNNQVSVTQIHYAPSQKDAAQKIRDALGFGELRANSDISAGRVLVIAGQDAVGQGLRTPGAAFTVPAVQSLTQPAALAAPAAGSMQPAELAVQPRLAAAVPDSIDGVPCVN